jgi:hypothetical protein
MNLLEFQLLTARRRAVAANSHEADNREVKIGRLIATLDVLRGSISNELTLATIERWGQADWNRLAVCAGCHPPSPVTQSQIVELLRWRITEGGEP